jgi:hypothetical protein
MVELDIAGIGTERAKGRVLLRRKRNDVFKRRLQRALAGAMRLDRAVAGCASLIWRARNIGVRSLMLAVARSTGGGLFCMHIRMMQWSRVAFDAGLIGRLARRPFSADQRRQIDRVRPQGMKITMALRALAIPGRVNRCQQSR